MWESLFVEGKWDDGQSKNKVQNACLSATNFAGSALENLLIANSVSYVIPAKAPEKVAAPALPAPPAAEAVALPTLVAPAAPIAPTAPVDVPWQAPTLLVDNSWRESAPATPVMNLPALPTVPQLPTV